MNASPRTALVWLILLGAALVAVPGSARAQLTNNWNNNSNGNWTLVQNWLNAPSALLYQTNILRFSGNQSYLSVNNFTNVPFPLHALAFQNNAAAQQITLTGNPLEFRPSSTAPPSIAQLGTSRVVISNSMHLTADLLLTGSGTGQLTNGGLISGVGVGLLKTGASTHTLTNDFNSFTGDVVLSEGTLAAIGRVTNTTVLGAGNLILRGGTLSLFAETNLVFGPGNGYSVTVVSNTTIRVNRLATGTNLAFTLGNLTIGDAQLTLSSGNGARLTIAGTTKLAGHATLSASNNLIAVNGPITDGGEGWSLTKVGANTLFITNLVNSSYSGGTLLRTGTLQVAASALASLPLGTGPVFLDGGTLQLRATGGRVRFGPDAGYLVHVRSNTTINVARNTGALVNGVLIVGGLTNSGATLTVTGANNFTLAIDGPVVLDGAATFNILNTRAANPFSLELMGSISEASPNSVFIKTGAQNLGYTNRANPTHTGGTRVLEGALIWRLTNAPPGAYQFGTGEIQLDGGGIFAFQHTVTSNYTFLNRYVAENTLAGGGLTNYGGGTLNFARQTAGSPQVTNTGAVLLRGPLDVHAGTVGSATPARFTGTVTLEGDDRTLSVSGSGPAGNNRIIFSGNFLSDGTPRTLRLMANNNAGIEISGDLSDLANVVIAPSPIGGTGRVRLMNTNALPAGKVIVQSAAYVGLGFNPTALGSSLAALSNRFDFRPGSALGLDVNSTVTLDLSPATGLGRDLRLGASEGLTATNSSGTIIPFADQYKFGAGGGTLVLTGNNRLVDGLNPRSLSVGPAPDDGPIGTVQPGTLTLTGDNPFSGGTLVNSGSLNIAAGAADRPLGAGPVRVSGTLTATGASGSFADATGLANANELTLLPGAVIQLDNLGAFNPNRFGDNAALHLDGARLNFIGRGSNGFHTTETIGGVTFSRGAQMEVRGSISNGAAGTLTLASLDRATAAATLQLLHGTNAAGAGAGDFGALNRLFVTAPPAVSNGIVAPWIVNATDHTHLTYDPAVGFTNATYNRFNLAAAQPDDLVSLGAGGGLLAGNVTIHALRTAGSIEQGGAGTTVTITSGGVIFAATASTTVGLDFHDGVQPVEGLIYVNGTATISNALSGAGLTKFGEGTLSLNVNQNYTNGWNLNRGAVTLAGPIFTSNQLGQAVIGNPVNLNGNATLTFNTLGTNLTYNSGKLVSFDNNILVANFGGVTNSAQTIAPLGLDLRATADGAPHLPAPISHLRIDVAQSRSLLRVGGPVTLHADAALNVRNTGGALGNTGGSNRVDFAGGLVGAGRALTKFGNGILGLPTDNSGTFTSGRITVNAGTLAVGHNGALGDAASTVTIAPGAVLELLAPLVNFNPLAGVTQSSGSAERWQGQLNRFTDPASEETFNVPAGVDLQLAVNLTGLANKTLRLNGGTLAAFNYLDDFRPNHITIGPGVVIELAADGRIGQSSVDIGRGGTVLSNLAAITEFGGPRSLTKVGLDTVVLGANNSYSGDTFIREGTLRLGIEDALPVTTRLSITNSAVFDLNGFNQSLFGLNGNGNVVNPAAAESTLTLFDEADALFAGPIRGSVNLTKLGPAALTLSGPSTYTGSLLVINGSIHVGADVTGRGSPLGDPASPVILTGESSLFTAGAFTVPQLIRVERTIGGLKTVGGLSADPSRFTGGLNLSDSVRLIAAAGGRVDLDGAITESAAGSGVTKTGPGTVSLNVANTYTGPTLVSQGALLVNNTAGSGTGSGDVTVAAGAMLGGAGFIAGTVMLNANATLAPGDSLGTLSVGNFTALADSISLFEISGLLPGVDYDQLHVTGTVTLGGTLEILLGFTPDLGDMFTLIQNDLDDAINGAFAGLPEGALLTPGGGPVVFSISYLGGTGNDVVLTTVVPEPGALSLLALGGLLSGLHWWRRRRSAAARSRFIGVPAAARAASAGCARTGRSPGLRLRHSPLRGGNRTHAARRTPHAALLAAALLLWLLTPLAHAAIVTNATVLTAEMCSPANGAIDPGETVTVEFFLANTGPADTTNLTATLRAGGGVTQPGGPQNYGVLTAGGAAVGRPFTFIANGPCGAIVPAVLQLADGGADLGAVTFLFRLGGDGLAFTENFDTTPAGSLPAGWTAMLTGAGAAWTVVGTDADTPPQSVFCPNPGTTSDNQLISPLLPIKSAEAVLSFRHRYNTELNFDGGRLDIALGAAALFTSISNAGGAFLTGGYNNTFSGGGGGPGWAGNSGGFITTQVRLPAAAAGQSIRLRWRFTSDASVAGEGWYVDSIQLFDLACCVNTNTLDLALGIQDAPDPGVTNAPVTYTLAVTNFGPAHATAVLLSNTLPAGMEFLEATASQGTCTNVGGVVICDLGDLGAKQTASAVITVVSPAPGLFTNRAAVIANELDFDLSNNSRSEVTVVNLSSLFINNVAVLEGDSGLTNAVFTVTLRPASTDTVTVSFTTSNGTAQAGLDYHATNGVLTFAPGQTTQTITVQVIGDTINEANETFFVLLTDPVNAVLGDGEGVGFINNDDPVPSLTISGVAVSEGDSGATDAVFPVLLSAPSGQSVSFRFATANGTALAGTDYLATNGLVILAPGVTATTVVVRVLGDIGIEPDETFFVNLSNVTNATLATNQAVGTILNDDGLPGQVHTFEWAAISSPQVAQEPFAVTITARDASNNVAASFTGTVHLTAVHGSGTGGAGGGTILSNIPGTGSGQGDFTIGYAFTPAVNLTVTHVRHYSGTKVSIWTDSGMLLASQAVGGPEGVWSETPLSPPLALVGGTTYRIGFYTGGTAGSYYFNTQTEVRSFSHGAVGEPYYTFGDGFPEFLIGGNNWLVDLRYQTGEGGAVSIAPTVSGSFVAGVWSGMVAVLQPATGVRLVATDAVGHQGTSQPFEVVVPDDVGLTVTVSPDPAPAGANLTYTLTATNTGPSAATGVVVTNHLPAGTVFVSVNSSQGSCTNVNGTVVCELGTLPGGTGATITLVVATTAGGTITNTATITRAETDPYLPNNTAVAQTTLLVPLLNINNVTVIEGNTGFTNANFTLTLSFPPLLPVSVGVATSNGTATAGLDYLATNAVATFAPGQTNQTFTVRVLGDLLDEANETYFVRLSNVVNATLVRLAATGTITDDDPLPGLSINDVSVLEGDSGATNAVFTVTLTPVSGRNVSVNFATANGTATAGSDYFQTNGTLTITAGQTTGQITVRVIGDTLAEADETFFVNLASPVNATNIRSQGIGTILNDDAIPAISVNDPVVAEGNRGTTSLDFQVTLSNPSGQIVTVHYATSNGTAQAGADYRADNGLLVFPPGVTNRTIPVVVFGDTRVEPDETVFLRVRNPVGATLAKPTGLGAIQNDDGLPGQVSYFAWDPLDPVQLVSQPFAGTITARDAFDNLASNFTGTVSLAGLGSVGDVTIGADSTAGPLPLATFFHDARVQSIYLAGEIGGARRLTALALDLTAPPGQFLNNWTIRLKHTPLSNYVGGAAWEGTGWTVVYQNNETITATGWVNFEFNIPFSYNGADHLMVDFSFNNSSYSSNGLCRFSTTAEPRTLFHRTDSGFGDPLAWSGAGSPTPTVSAQRVNIRLSDGTNVVVSPPVSGAFSNGVWTGALTVSQPAERLTLRADDNEGHVGLTGPIRVVTMLEPAPDSDGDGLPDAWEIAHGLDPFDPTDAAGDLDGDRMTNLQEYLAGTNPRDPANHLCILSVTGEGGEVRITFTTVAGRRYCVERCESLGGPWSVVGGVVTGVGAPVELIDPDAPAKGTRLYRVRLLP